MTTTSPFGSGKTTQLQQQEDTRLPSHPAIGSTLLRLLFVVLNVVYGFREAIVPWASQTLSSPPPDGPWGPLVQMVRIPAQGLNLLLTPPVVDYFSWGLLGVWLLVLLELVVALLMTAFMATPQRVSLQHFRIRAPGPFNSSPVQGTTAEEFYRGLHGAITGAGNQFTKMALLLTGRENRPTRLSTAIRGAVPRQTWFDTLRSVLRRQEDGIIIDPTDDQLVQAVRDCGETAWLSWCELRPRLGPQFPMRLGDDSGESLFSFLATAAAPRADVALVECQVLLQPRDPRLERFQPWRILAERRLKKMRRKTLFQVSADAKLLEEKIENPALFATTIRLVAVSKSEAAAQTALAPLLSAFTQYSTQSIRGDVQQFIPKGKKVLKLRTTKVLKLRTTGMTLLGSLLSLFLFFLMVSGILVGIGTPLITLIGGIGFPFPPGTVITTGLALFSVGVVLWGFRRTHGSAERAVFAREPRPMPPKTWMIPFSFWRGPAILAASELAGLWGIPPKTLQTSVEWLPCRVIPTPPSVMKPQQPPPNWIAVGSAYRPDGSTIPVGTVLREFRRVCHITAGMGAGKSRLAANLCEQFIALKTGFILIDGKGDDVGGLTRTVRTLIPPEEEENLVIIDLLDPRWMIGLNPLAGVEMNKAGAKAGAVDLVLGQIRSIFERLDPATWSKSPGMQQYLDMSALLVLYGQENPNLANVSQVLVDEAYRAKLLPKCQNTEVRQFWEIRYPQLGETQRSSMHALLRRFDMLLVPELTRYMTTSPTSFDLVKAIAEHRIILVPVPHITLGGLAASVAMLIFQQVIRAAFQREGTDQSREDYPMIIDELQVIAAHGSAQDMEIALSQLRAQGIPSFYLHQALMQIGDLKDLMMNNAMNRIILRTQEPDASTYAHAFPGSGLVAADISGQDPMEHQYAILSTSEGPQGPFSMRPLPWPAPVEASGGEPGPLANWKAAMPEGPEGARVVDRLVSQLMHAELAPDQEREALALLAKAPDEVWECVLSRWQAVRRAQRAYLLRYPGSISDRLERQQWLSRLGYSDGSLLMAAAYQRARPEVAVPPPGEKKRKGEPKQKTPPAFVSPVEEETEAAPEFQSMGRAFDALTKDRGARRKKEDSMGSGFDG